MVDVGVKGVTHRVAVATGRVTMKPSTLRLIIRGGHKKGDVLQVARIAAIAAAKETHRLIPLCHLLSLTKITVDLTIRKPRHVDVTARVEAVDRTGVEMEALTAVAIGCLTVYDMCKAVEKGMAIGDIKLLEKSGGKSGVYRRRTR